MQISIITAEGHILFIVGVLQSNGCWSSVKSNTPAVVVYKVIE